MSTAIEEQMRNCDSLRIPPEHAVANGKASKSSGEAWTMRAGKLYLNANKDVQARWMGGVSQNIYFADREWRGLKGNLEKQ